MSTNSDIREVVRERYTQAAQQNGMCCGSTCCGGAADVNDIATQIGYKIEDLAVLPEGANLGLGCGNPLEFARVQPGEIVLDLGSGAGIDCLLAARAVGESGFVIGVDMTPAMLAKARINAQTAGVKHVEFRLGEIEHLPVADSSVDVVISNCVINLSPDKLQVFRDIKRVLKPGGRLLVSDLVLRRPLSERLKNSVEAYVGCVAGAILKDDYVRLAREAGLADVEVVDEHAYDVQFNSIDSDLQTEALAAVVSVKVRAVKPATTCCGGRP